MIDIFLYIYIYPSIHSFQIYPFIDPSTHRFIDPSIYPSICIFYIYKYMYSILRIYTVYMYIHVHEWWPKWLIEATKAGFHQLFFDAK